MEATALSFTLMLMLVVGSSYADDGGAAFARIVPTSLQLFDYSSVSFNCESLNITTGWRVSRKVGGEVGACVSNWETAAASVCAIGPVYPTDSGEYWCETGDGDRSSSVNITVTAGDVILESPVLPVVEGEAVTLYCRNKRNSAHAAHFYKDGVLVGSGSSGEMTVHNVSKSNEGLYKCISAFGESPESWLAVRARHTEETQTTSTSSDPHHSCHIYLIVRTAFTVVMVALLLLLMGLLRFRKLRATQK